MPMIDVYAAAGTFTDKHQLAEAVPGLPPGESCSPRDRPGTAPPGILGPR
jgi:hypothetical protein